MTQHHRHRQAGLLAAAGRGDQVDQVRDLALDRRQAHHALQPRHQRVHVPRVRAGGAGGGQLDPDVDRQQAGQVGGRRVRAGGQPLRLPADHLLEDLAGLAAVGERVAAMQPLEIGTQHVRGVRLQRVPVRVAEPVHDRDQLVGPVVLELDGPGEAGRQPRVGGQEAAHLLGVAGRDHDHVVAVVLHQLEQGVDGLLAEVRAAAGVGGQRVRLVDEQHPAAGRVELLRGLDRGAADVLGHQVGPGHLDHVAGAEHAQGGEDLRVEAGDRGLAGAGRPGEDQVPAHRRRRQAGLDAAQRELVEVDQHGHFLLYPGEADQ